MRTSIDRPARSAAYACAAAGIRRDVGRDEVIRHDAGELREPERRQLREHLALVGNARSEHVVERRDAIGGDDQQRIAEVVDVAHLARAEAAQRRKLRAGERGREHHVGGASANRRMVADAGNPSYSYSAAGLSMRQHLRTIIAIAAAGGLLALFLRNTDLHQVGARDRARRARACSSLALVHDGADVYVFRAVRWQYLLRPLGHVALRATRLRTTIIGFAASALLPARAGEVLRPYPARAQGRLQRHRGVRDDHPRAPARHGDGADPASRCSCCSSTPGVDDRRRPRRFEQVKLGGARRRGRAASSCSSCCSFSPAIPARSSGSTSGLTRVLPDSLGATAGAARRATFAEGLGDRAAAGAAAGGAGAVGAAVAVDRARASGW